MPTEEASSSGGCTWSWKQEKAFESALVTHSDDCDDRWERIAAEVPDKTAEEVKRHFEVLLEDIDGIESGLVPLPCYASSSEGSADESGGGKKGGGRSGHGKKMSRSDQERRKGIAWTEDEHRLFLLGLEKYGKGDWRSISRNFVISRTPTQVASHAQKYFIRLNSMNKDRRRSSIHDITSVDKGNVSTPPGPVIGVATSPTSGSVKPAKNAANQPAIGQPVGPLVSAVGTPVTLPAPAHIIYGSPPPLPPATGAVVPGTPINVLPANFSVPQKSSKK